MNITNSIYPDDISGTIIGVTGVKRSGKDSIAVRLVEEYGFVRYAFADPIKIACKGIFGFTDEQCWGDLKDVVDEYWKITPRKIFQIFGTELFQYELPKHAKELADIGRGFWVYVFARWYERQLAKYPDIKIVVTDVRFPFEADMITRLGGTIIKVARSEQLDPDMHASETEMNLIPYSDLIENTGSLTDLYHKIDKRFKLW